MQRIDIDRVISAKFAFEEAMNAAFHGSHDRLVYTSIALPTTKELRQVSEAVGVLPTAKSTDDDCRVTMWHVYYGGCSFWCHAEDAEVTRGL